MIRGRGQREGESKKGDERREEEMDVYLPRIHNNRKQNQNEDSQRQEGGCKRDKAEEQKLVKEQEERREKRGNENLIRRANTILLTKMTASHQ